MGIIVFVVLAAGLKYLCDYYQVISWKKFITRWSERVATLSKDKQVEFLFSLVGSDFESYLRDIGWDDPDFFLSTIEYEEILRFISYMGFEGSTEQFIRIFSDSRKDVTGSIELYLENSFSQEPLSLNKRIQKTNIWLESIFSDTCLFTGTGFGIIESLVERFSEDQPTGT